MSILKRITGEKYIKNGRILIIKDFKPKDIPEDIIEITKRTIIDLFFTNPHFSKLRKLKVKLHRGNNLRKEINALKGGNTSSLHSTGTLAHTFHNPIVKVQTKVIRLNLNVIMLAWLSGLSKLVKKKFGTNINDKKVEKFIEKKKTTSLAKFFKKLVTEAMVHESTHLIHLQKNDITKTRSKMLLKLYLKTKKIIKLKKMIGRNDGHMLPNLRVYLHTFMTKTVCEGIARVSTLIVTKKFSDKWLPKLYRDAKKTALTFRILFDIAVESNDSKEIIEFINDTKSSVYEIGSCVVATILIANPELDLEDIMSMTITKVFRQYVNASKQLNLLPVIAYTRNHKAILNYSKLTEKIINAS